MHSDLLVSALTVIWLIILSAFFSAGETSMTAASSARMLAAEKDGDLRAKLVNKILASKERMIGAMLLGNNLINILASALTTSVLIGVFGEAGVYYATAIMTVLVLIFAEVLPKTYAFHHADKFARLMAPVFYVVILVFSPITDFIAKIVRVTLKLFGADILSVDESQHVELLRGAIEMHQGDTKEVTKQRNMLRSILELSDVTVQEVMIHRQNVSAVNVDDSPQKIVADILHSKHSRIPMWKDTPDNIVGFVHAKWILEQLQETDGNFDKINIQRITAHPWFIPETTTLFDQLQAFRDRGELLAFVVDEYGSYQGIVTLEDILEEIVGEIDDEHDEGMPGVRKQLSGSFIVNGTVTIRDLNRELDWELPDDRYTTIAGLVLYEAEQIPDVGQSYTFFGYRFDILRRHKNQIMQMKVTPPNKKPVFQS